MFQISLYIFIYVYHIYLYICVYISLELSTFGNRSKTTWTDILSLFFFFRKRKPLSFTLSKEVHDLVSPAPFFCNIFGNHFYARIFISKCNIFIPNLVATKYIYILFAYISKYLSHFFLPFQHLLSERLRLSA